MYSLNIHGNSTYNLVKGVQRYIQDEFGNEAYITRNGYQIYAFDFIRKRENFALDRNKNEFYCKRDSNEVYALSLNSGYERFAVIAGGTCQKYAVDKYGNEKYPLNLHRKEKMAKRKMKSHPEFFYARLKNKDEYYLIDELREEVLFVDKGSPLIAMTSEGLPKTPLSKNKRVKYNIDNKTLEVLFQFNGEPFFGKDMSGEEVYPKNLITKCEYYPNNKSKLMIAKDSFGNKKYALDNKQKIIYPKNETNGNLFYIMDDNRDEHIFLKKQANHFENYVSPDKYPIKNTEFGVTEILINSSLLKRYPFDSNFNEYTNKNGDIIEHLSYPLSNDNFLILPNVKNKPVIKAGDEYLYNRIKYLIYRPEFDSYDFLTDVKSKRQSTAKHRLPYKVLTLSNYKLGTFNVDYYIVGCLFAVILFLLICILI